MLTHRLTPVLLGRTHELVVSRRADDDGNPNAAPQHHDLVTPLRKPQQLGEARLCFKRSDFVHHTTSLINQLFESSKIRTKPEPIADRPLRRRHSAAIGARVKIVLRALASWITATPPSMSAAAYTVRMPIGSLINSHPSTIATSGFTYA